MYKYDENKLPISNRRRRIGLQYVHLKDKDGLKDFEQTSYVYCPKSKILITCDFGGHWEAMQEHLCDYIDAKGWSIAPNDDNYMFYAGDTGNLSDDKVAECERFLLEELVLYSIYTYSGGRAIYYFLDEINSHRKWIKVEPYELHHKK